MDANRSTQRRRAGMREEAFGSVEGMSVENKFHSRETVTHRHILFHR